MDEAVSGDLGKNGPVNRDLSQSGHEVVGGGGNAGDPTHASVLISTEELVAASRAALTRVGTPPDIADRVVATLLESERAGRPSHGVLRLPEYVAAVRAGTVKPAARPTILEVSPSCHIVDGHGCFGTLAVDAVVDQLSVLAEHGPLSAVGLRNASHLGRLGLIGERVVRNDLGVLGFVSFHGVGGRCVVPWQGTDARLCTNPLLIALPGGEQPFVLDISTSTVSEGTVRAHWQAGEPVPDGWLVDSAGRTVTDPAPHYVDPPTAFLTPLGGRESGHKGFGLALAVELLAGVLTGAGFAGSPTVANGNRGLFIGVDPTLLAQSLDSIVADSAELRAYVTASAPGRVHWPGSGRGSSAATGAPDVENLRVSRRVWEAINRD